MATIPKNTQIRIDGTRDGMARISVVGMPDDYLMDSFSFPFFKLVLSDQPDEAKFDSPVTADDWVCDDVKTVENWDKNQEWKGVSPCLTGVASFDEGWGPWFLAPEDLEVYTQAELDAEALADA